MPSFANTLMKLPTRSKIVLGAGALGVLLVLVFMLRLASAPSYSTLVAALDPAETGKVTAALDEQGIAYELRANGTTVAVEKASVAQALAAGTAQDPTAVVMAVERAQLSMQLASQIRNNLVEAATDIFHTQV